MDILSLVILGITVYFLFFGIIFGLARGALRSAVRLVTLGIGIAVAWFARKSFVKILLNLNFGGQSLNGMLEEMAAEAGGAGAAISNILLAVIESLFAVIVFILAVIVLKLITAILFFIIKFFIPKQEKKNAGIGALIGLVQGALIAFFICAPLNGLLGNVSQLMNLEVGGEPVLPAETKAEMQEMGLDFEKYNESALAKVYTTLGDGLYKKLASSEVDGKTVSLSGTVEAVEAGAKFVGALESISQIDMSNGMTTENREELLSTFKELDAIKANMSDEAKDTINTLISTVVQEAAGTEEIPAEITEILENFDFSEVNFEKEGGMILDFMDYTEKGEESEVTPTELVNSLAESTVILPMIEDMVESEGETMELPEEHRDEFIAAINQVSDAEKAETLRKIFGLN